MDTIHFWETIILLIGLHFSAGPANILMASSVSKQGIMRTAPVFIGLWIPVIIYTLLIGFILKEFIDELTFYMQIVSLLGACYIFYLSYKLFMPPLDRESVHKSQSHFTLKDGFILNALNGKLFVALSLVFSVGLTPQASITGVVIIISLFIVFGVLANVSWGMGGKILLTVAGNQHQRKLNIVYSILLFGVALWIFYDSVAKIYQI